MHRKPVVAVKPVEHRENTHLREVAAAVVFLHADCLLRKVPQLRHDFRIEHVETQRFGHQPDDVRRPHRTIDLQRRQGVVQRTVLYLQPVRCLFTLGDAYPGSQFAKCHGQVQRIALAGKQDGLVIDRRTVAIGKAFAHARRQDDEHQPAPLQQARQGSGRCGTARYQPVIGEALERQQCKNYQACRQFGAAGCPQ